MWRGVKRTDGIGRKRSMRSSARKPEPSPSSRLPPPIEGMTIGEQAARWLAEQPGDLKYSDAAQRFGISRRTVKKHWLQLGFKPLAFQGEVAARWLANQSGNLGFAKAAQHFGIAREVIRKAWHRLGLGDTPLDKANHPKRDRAEIAARWLADQAGDTGYTEAGKRFGISHHMIRDTWKRLKLGDTPREKKIAELRAAVLAFARSKKSRSQIKALTGISPRAISKWCKAAGISIRSEKGKKNRRSPDPAAIARGLQIIRKGGSTAEGASAAGVSYGTFRHYVKAAKIKARPQHKAKILGGRIEQAALLVDLEGFSIEEAAAIVEIAPTNVRVYVRRHATNASAFHPTRTGR